MSLTVIPTRLIAGVPKEPKPFRKPAGCVKAKLRFRNDAFAMVVMKMDDGSFIRRAVEEAGDYYVADDFGFTQGTNTYV